MKPNIKTIRASIQRRGVMPKVTRKFKIKTDTNYKQPVFPNLQGQEFKATVHNQK